jgi:hypothetical protein
MTDIEALAAAGLTKKALKKIFTAEPPKGAAKTEARSDPSQSDVLNFRAIADKQPWQIRQRLEREICDELWEGMLRNADLFSRYGAIDMAYEAGDANKTQLPFMKVAHGLIDLKRCSEEISRLSPDMAAALFKKKGNDTIKINAPRLFETPHNLVHSLVTRRVASVATPIVQRSPFYKYESRSTTQVGRLRADGMTQRAEIMADQYGHRDDAIQAVRACSLYGRQLEFKRSAWSCDKQVLRKRNQSNGASRTGNSKPEFKETVVREGVEFVAPHPTRWGYDMSEPLSKLNTDTGPNSVFYWDMIRVGSIRANAAYYNTEDDKFRYDSGVYDFIAANPEYFTQYYRNSISAPAGVQGNAANLSLDNDRKFKINNYAQTSDRATTTIAEFFKRIVPKDYGIGTYAHPVWIRFVVAGNNTVIFAEPCGSPPACYYNYNESSDRDLSPTFAMQAMHYQDQTSNLLTQLLEIQHQGLLRIFSINTDGLDKKQIEEIEDTIRNRSYYAAKSIIVKYSMQQVRDRGGDPREYMEKVRQTELQTREKITEVFESFIKLLQIAERLLFFSPQELGQVSPREVTATEANMVNSTTLGIRDFHGLGIDMGLDAKKRIIYESLINFGSDEIEIPVAERYDPAVVAAAGFTVVKDGSGVGEDNDTYTISGSKWGLVHDFIFTSRDGFDRPLPSAEAQALVTALDVAARDQQLGQAMSWGQKFDLYNELVRKISGVNLRLRVPPGVDRDAPIGGGPQMEQAFKTLADAVQQIAAAQQKQQADMQSLSGTLADLAKAVTGLAGQQTRNTRRGTVAPGIPGAPLT